MNLAGTAAQEHRRVHGERGAVAGLEALLLGFLVLLGGVGLMVNTWTVVETRTALDAATREYLRVYTAQSDPAAAAEAGAAAARRVLVDRGTPLQSLVIDAPDPSRFGPCQPVEVTLSVEVDELRVPFIDRLGPSSVSVRGAELVDAHREITSGVRHDPEATPCAG